MTPVYGKPVGLECQVLGACADVGITWYHRSYNSSNELSFRTLPDIQTTKTSSNQYSFLDIDNYGENDDGIYNCKVDLFDKPIVSPDTLVIGGKFRNDICYFPMSLFSHNFVPGFWSAHLT